MTESLFSTIRLVNKDRHWQDSRLLEWLNISQIADELPIDSIAPNIQHLVFEPAYYADGQCQGS